MRTFEIGANDAGQRLDKFLSKAVKRLPKSLLYKSIRLKRIKVNGKRCEISTRLQPGDIVDLYINDEFFGDTPLALPFLVAPPMIDVVYEDDNILLVNKHPGLVVHEDESGSEDTLIHRIQHYLYNKGEYRPEQEHSFSPALCNRIDRNTGGIVIAAKNAQSLRILNQKIKNRELRKLYLCVVRGILDSKNGEWKAYLKKDETTNTVMVSNRKAPDNRTIITAYRVLEETKNYSLVEVDLKTGRTHQIRAHFAYMGHPLVGDGKYGKLEKGNLAGVRQQLLYSYRLDFCFTTDAGILTYLNGKSFCVQDIWFAKNFHEIFSD